MSKFQELEREQARHATESRRLLEAIRAEIKALPDNPRITRFPGTLHAFVMSSKDLGGNWSVEHHDFKKQYELIAKEITKASEPMARLRQVLTDGKIRLNGSYAYTVTLHPDVIANVSRLGGFRWKSVAEWPAGKFPSIGDKSEDTHGTRDEAEAICRMLKDQGFGGEGKVFPVRTGVEAVS